MNKHYFEFLTTEQELYYIYNRIGNFFTFLRLNYKIKNLKPSSIASIGWVSNE